MLVSPYSWLEEYTPVSQWVGGTIAPEGQPEDSFSQVQQILSPYFELVHREDMPFLIREHARKYQWGVSDCLVWKKR